jgi:hypothetical protein
MMDPENRVVMLCAQGMESEFGGRIDDASEGFRKAWDLLARLELLAAPPELSD